MMTSGIYELPRSFRPSYGWLGLVTRWLEPTNTSTRATFELELELVRFKPADLLVCWNLYPLKGATWLLELEPRVAIWRVQIGQVVKVVRTRA